VRHYSAGCRKTSQALSTKAAAAFTSRAQATPAKKCSSYSSRNTGESSPRIYFFRHASVLLRYEPLLLAAGRVQLISCACSDLLHKFLHIERKSILHKAHGNFFIGNFPRSGRTASSSSPCVTRRQRLSGSVCNALGWMRDTRRQHIAPGLHTLS